MLKEISENIKSFFINHKKAAFITSAVTWIVLDLVINHTILHPGKLITMLIFEFVWGVFTLKCIDDAVFRNKAALTTATITHTGPWKDRFGGVHEVPYVTYVIKGIIYKQPLGEVRGGLLVKTDDFGDKVWIYYDPKNPEVILRKSFGMRIVWFVTTCIFVFFILVFFTDTFPGWEEVYSDLKEAFPGWEWEYD